MTQNMPFQTQQPIFGKVGHIGELVHMTADERAKYNISIDSYRTSLSVMKNEREEGRAEEKMQIATKMKERGFTDEMILELTGLTIEEIVKL